MRVGFGLDEKGETVYLNSQLRRILSIRLPPPFEECLTEKKRQIPLNHCSHRCLCLRALPFPPPLQDRGQASQEFSDNGAFTKPHTLIVVLLFLCEEIIQPEEVHPLGKRARDPLSMRTFFISSLVIVSKGSFFGGLPGVFCPGIPLRHPLPFSLGGRCRQSCPLRIGHRHHTRLIILIMLDPQTRIIVAMYPLFIYLGPQSQYATPRMQDFLTRDFKACAQVVAAICV